MVSWASGEGIVLMIEAWICLSPLMDLQVWSVERNDNLCGLKSCGSVEAREDDEEDRAIGTKDG